MLSFCRVLIWRVSQAVGGWCEPSSIYVHLVARNKGLDNTTSRQAPGVASLDRLLVIIRRMCFEIPLELGIWGPRLTGRTLPSQETLAIVRDFHGTDQPRRPERNSTCTQGNCELVLQLYFPRLHRFSLPVVGMCGYSRPVAANAKFDRAHCSYHQRGHSAAPPAALQRAPASLFLGKESCASRFHRIQCAVPDPLQYINQTTNDT